MISANAFRGQSIALFGLGGSGLATALSLIDGGALVSAWDDSEAAREKALAGGIPIVDLRDADWGNFKSLVLTPGVPLTHPEPHWAARMAQAANVDIIGDIEIFARERRLSAPGSPLVCITGTNGKSTTTSLIAHLLRSAGRQVEMGGNIGMAVLSLAPPSLDVVHVLEISSFQMDLAPSLDPTIGILLNITPDHLDRHGTMELYAAVKERMVAGASMSVVGVDDAYCITIANRNEAAGRATIRISTQSPLPRGLYADGSMIHFARGGSDQIVADISGIGTLRGTHNAQNACAAIAAVSLMGVDADAIAIGLKTYPGLPHRMEEVGQQGRVLFINDSKATNADSSDKALSSFPGSIYWILGGRPKAGGIAALEPYFERVSRAYLIGEATDEFAKTLDGKLAYERCVTLERATEAAAMDASLAVNGNPVVLLSPACASYDQFSNFEVRGNAFRELVLALPKFKPRTGSISTQQRVKGA